MTQKKYKSGWTWGQRRAIEQMRHYGEPRISNRAIQFGLVGVGGMLLTVGGPVFVSRGDVRPITGFFMTMAGIASIVASVLGMHSL